MSCGHNPIMLSHLWVGAAWAMRIAINKRCANLKVIKLLSRLGLSRKSEKGCDV
jgi:hypothetical protein